MRDLGTLPKAHLHLHLTGAMRPTTLVELASRHGVDLPAALLTRPDLSETATRGWWRFQRLYDAARSVLRTPADLHRLLREIAEDEAAAGSGWVEVQVDPTTYGGWLGGLVPALDVLVHAAGSASEASGVGVALVVAANRTRHPQDAAALARLAARHVGSGPGAVVGFGLSNDERRGPAGDFAQAFRIASAAGLLAVPHGGELAGAASVLACMRHLGAQRVGHGVRAVEDPAVLAEMARRGVVAEVCPTSNVALSVAADASAVPLRALLDAGVGVALGADDPLLLRSGLVEQYELARRVHGLTDAALAGLARTSVTASAAPPSVAAQLLAGIDGWLADPA